MSDDPLRVLHVDDQHLWRSTVADYLPLFGNYDIISAESGEKALSLLRNASFDIIISDFQMPEMNGIQLLDTIRRQGNTIPFILFTGIKREDLAIRAKESGSDFYVVKTGDPGLLFSDLNLKILQAIEKQKTIDALFSCKVNETEHLLL
jgi:CheY-like chemotaxis protein